jgi:HSP20 family protein
MMLAEGFSSCCGRLEVPAANPISGTEGIASVPVQSTGGLNMHYRSLFHRDLFAELDRLQREMQQAYEWSPSIRGGARGGFPALNVGGTPRSVEVYVFAPGIDPAGLDVQIEKEVLTISGERKPVEAGEKATVHIDERFAGRFRRVVTLPEDVDANAVTARYRDGVLRISIARREAAQPRRIAIQ